VAILASGGKESLLSEGLLREIGYETHPIFVNESGKHWFTALNAYRHYAATHPNATRVWTNSDRLFAWMLRHLPFIREDFGKLRADDYPIRLWTVAVFLFGALPIVLKRGIGRVVIGDEFDTTVRRFHRGIPHYDGLYDQSRYFDQAMNRFFQRKSWPICQFSILRPLSELLVEKVLVERYPELQRAQISCHAAHIDGGRVRPCGNCEKCARVVGMLKALGADPRECSYTDPQIERSWKNLTARGASQEVPALEHLAYLLAGKGNGLPVELGSIRARNHPEIMKLRFDSERSPMDDIETSTALATRPELVQMDEAKKFIASFSSRYLDFGSKRSVDWYVRTARISPSGVLGDPTVASCEKGEQMWNLMIEHLVGLVEHLKQLSLDEIHQRRGQ